MSNNNRGQNVDLNVDNYSPEDLFTILDLNSDNASIEDITKSTNNYIDQYNADGDDVMANFFQDIQDTLINYVDSINNTQTEDEVKNGANDTTDYDYASAQKQTSNWLQNQVLKQSDQNQNNKVTDRKQKIDVYNDPHLSMKREQLGINNNVSVPIAQDKLNPNLENITKRFINLDSKYRQITGLNGVATDYTLDLSDPLLNAISLRLYSFQIPVSWYNVSSSSSCFLLSFNNLVIFPHTLNSTISISIIPGRYDSTSLPVALNDALNSLFTFPTLTPVTYNSISSTISMNLYGGINILDNTISIDDTTIITFFSTTGSMCSSNCYSNSNTFNYTNTLGYLMGYRSSTELVNLTGNNGTALLDLFGPKYLILVIDDYNQNHINNGLIGITEYSNTLKLPSYYNSSFPTQCTSNTGVPADFNILTAKQLNVSYKPTITVLPTAPRILTQAQIYSVNQILKNNENNTTYRTAAPTTTDTFAIIPIKGDLSFGSVYTDFSGSVQDNRRTYFGPVSIDRLHVKLLDDKGNLLDLHGLDWSITLICENLYQY